MGDDLGFGSAGTGAAIAVFFLASGMTAIPVGWITNRVGAPIAMRVGVTLSGPRRPAGWSNERCEDGSNDDLVP